MLFLMVMPGTGRLLGQETTVEKSLTVEKIDGREYYLHTVEQGHTLYAISRVYDVPVDELLFENPDAAAGLAIGQVLRVPLVSRDKIITDDIHKGEFRFIFHIVKKGETLYAISRLYDVPAEDLKKANPEWEKGLREGQYLKIPVKENVISPEGEPLMQNGGKVHHVLAGETLYSISRKYKVGLPELRAANPGITNNLTPGQQIRIPDQQEGQEKPSGPRYAEHTVSRGETLYAIATRYRISVDSLMAFNPGLTKNIFPGEVIRIPARVNPRDYITHEVREKTKLKTIATRYSISVSEIKEANPDYRSRVRPGDLLHIPVGPPPDVATVEVEAEKVTEPEEIPSADIKIDSVLCYEGDHDNQKELKIALMIPMYTEEAGDIDISGMTANLRPEDHKPFNFIQFYEGFMMALDELGAEGLNARVYVYDVDEKVSKTIQVLQQPELQEMDLIIGPFFSRNFTLVSNFAQMFGIRIVNPLTRRTEVLDNPMVIKMKPSRDAQPAILADFVEKYHRGSNIILVRNNKFQYEDLVREIRAELEKISPYGVNVPNAGLYDLITEYSEADTNLASGVLLNNMLVENRLIRTERIENSLSDSTFFPNGISEVIYATDSVYGIIRNASVVRENLVVVLTNNEVFAPEILTRLNDLKDTFDITVVGMPEWDLLDNLETDYLLDLNVYFFAASYYDFNDPGVIRFIGDFRYRYKTHPNAYAFEGYDIARYFLGAMMRFGPDCGQCLQYYPARLLTTRVKMKPAYPAGYENLYWNLCRYRDYTVIKVNDP